MHEENLSDKECIKYEKHKSVLALIIFSLNSFHKLLSKSQRPEIKTKKLGDLNSY
jgi:hypothetical protein